VGQTWEIDSLRAALAHNAPRLSVRDRETGREFEVVAAFSDHERSILLDGGLLRHLREGGRTLTHQHVESGAAER
jgi:hypothetical protein